MKRMRLHILAVAAIYVVLFVIGSFLDLQINQSLFSQNNGFGLTCSAFVLYVGYGFIAFLGGMLIHQMRGSDLHKAWRILFIILGVIAGGVAIYFSGKELFSPNGFNNPKMAWLGYLIAAPFMIGFCLLGYLTSKKADNNRLWVIVLLLLGACLVALVAGTTGLKSLMHRPRYRIAIYEGYVPFHAWWQRCADYKTYMEQYGLVSEEFKSFPSGHSSVSALAMMGACFMPAFNKENYKIQIPVFYCGFAWALFVGFTRMLVGAHFLSDISFGGLLTVIVLFIANELAIRLRVFREAIPTFE